MLRGRWSRVPTRWASRSRSAGRTRAASLSRLTLVTAPYQFGPAVGRDRRAGPDPDAVREGRGAGGAHVEAGGRSAQVSDYYDVLGVPHDADEATLKQAYRKLAMEYHPDRNNGDRDAEAKFKELTEAYEVLRDPEKRAVYDRYGEAGLRGRAGQAQGFHAFDLSEALNIFMRDFGGFGGFEELFGGRGRGQHAGPPWQRPQGVGLAQPGRGGDRHQEDAQVQGAGAVREVRRQRRQGGHGARDLPDLRRQRRAPAGAALDLRPVRLGDAVPGLRGRGPRRLRHLHRSAAATGGCAWTARFRWTCRRASPRPTTSRCAARGIPAPAAAPPAT